MNLADSLLAGGFSLLSLMALPLPGPRRLVLSTLRWCGNSALLGGVAACGLFAFAPDLASPPLARLLAAAAPEGLPAVAWLVKATLLVVIALPLLAHLDHARELAQHADFLRRVRKELRAAEESLPASPRRHIPEVAAAVEAMRAAAGSVHRPSPEPRKLVKDLLDFNA